MGVKTSWERQEEAKEIRTPLDQEPTQEPKTKVSSALVGGSSI